MKKYASKSLAIISLLSLFLQSAYPVILAYEDTDAGSGTSCTLSVDKTNVTQGDSVTFTLNSGYGYSAYWGGSNNSQPIGGNYPLAGFSSTANSSWQGTYRQDTLGTFSRYIEILNEEGSIICTTNTIAVNVAASAPEPTALSCETKKIADCVRRECDPGLQRMVCIDKWEEDNCAVVDKPGVATDQRCGIPPGQGATAPTSLETCFRQECDTSINQMVCIDKWNICKPEGCTETEKPGRLFGQSCVTSAPSAVTQPADTPAEPAPIITYPGEPICSLQATPQTIQVGNEITWHIYADPAGISANWIGPDVNQPSKVEGYPEGTIPNWFRTYTYNQSGTYTRQSVINYSSAQICTTNPITITINPPSVGAAAVEPDINIDFQGITPPLTIDNESRQLAAINQDVAVTTDQPPPNLPPLPAPREDELILEQPAPTEPRGKVIIDAGSQDLALEDQEGLSVQYSKRLARIQTEARESNEGSQGNPAEAISSAANNVGNVGVGVAQAIGGAAQRVGSFLGSLAGTNQEEQQKLLAQKTLEADDTLKILNDPNNTAEEKNLVRQYYRQKFNLTSDTSDQQIISAIGDQVKTTGIKIETDSSGNYQISLEEACILNPLSSACLIGDSSSIQGGPPPDLLKTAEDVADFVTNGGLDVLRKGAETRALKSEVRELRKQAGIEERAKQSKEVYKQARGGYVFEDSTSPLLFRELVLDKQQAPNSLLSEEQVSARQAYEEKLTELAQKEREGGTALIIWAALGLEGGKVTQFATEKVVVPLGKNVVLPVVRKITDPIGDVAKGAWDTTLGRIFGGAGKEVAQESAEKVRPPTSVRTAEQALEQPAQPVHIDSRTVSAGVGNSPRGVREILAEEINKITGGRARVTVSEGMVTVFDERGRQIFGSGLTDKGPTMTASVFTEGRRSPFAEKILETWESAMAGLGYSKVFAEIFEDNGWEFLYRMGYRRTGDSHILVKELTPATAAERIAARNAAVTSVPQVINSSDKEAIDGLIGRVFPSGKTAGKNRALVIAWIDSGATEDLIQKKADQARRLVDYMFEGSGVPTEGIRTARPPGPDAPQEIKDAWNAFRFDWGFEAREVTDFKRDNLVVAVTDALINQHINARDPKMAAVLNKTNSKLEEIGAYIAQNNPHPHPQSTAYRVGKEQVHIVSSDTIDRTLGATGFGGFAIGDQVVIKQGFLSDVEEATSVVLHECIHTCRFTLQNLRQREVISRTLGVDNFTKFDEGVTEFATQFVSDNAALQRAMRSDEPLARLVSSADEEYENWTYRDLVAAVHDELIPEIMRRNGFSREQASAIVLNTVRNGQYTDMVTSVGGLSKLSEIFGKLPEIVGNTSARSTRVITPTDKQLALFKAKAEISAGLPLEKTPKSLPWRLIGSVFAQEENTTATRVLATNTLEALTKKELIKNALIEDGQVDSSFVKEVAKTEIFTSETGRTRNGYILATGKSGLVEGSLEQGKYKVEIASIPGVDIKIPGVIDVKTGQETVIPVAIKTGTGKVEKIAAPTGWRWLLNKLFGTVFAQEKKESQVQMVVFSDTNNNGKIDKNEQVLPWAGLKVELKKVNQDRTIALNPGWNLVALEVLPQKPINASTLLQEIAKQGGYATTVSTLENGAWKSFVVRGDKTYSGDDFPITPGKAYFVKALKSSVLVYQGQELVAPIKLNLASGWNGVGIPYSAKPYQAADFIDTLNTKGAESDTASRWESGLWDTFVKLQDQGYGENFMIEQGRGYLLKVARGLEFSP